MPPRSTPHHTCSCPPPSVPVYHRSHATYPCLGTGPRTLRTSCIQDRCTQTSSDMIHPPRTGKPRPLQGGHVPGHPVPEMVARAMQVPGKEDRCSSTSTDHLKLTSGASAIPQATPTSGVSVIKIRAPSEMVISRVLDPRDRTKPLIRWRCATPRVSNNVTSSNWARSVLAMDSRSSGDSSAVRDSASSSTVVVVGAIIAMHRQNDIADSYHQDKCPHQVPDAGQTSSATRLALDQVTCPRYASWQRDAAPVRNVSQWLDINGLHTACVGGAVCVAGACSSAERHCSMHGLYVWLGPAPVLNGIVACIVL
jgi:hypothetical protein